MAMAYPAPTPATKRVRDVGRISASSSDSPVVGWCCRTCTYIGRAASGNGRIGTAVYWLSAAAMVDGASNAASCCNQCRRRPRCPSIPPRNAATLGAHPWGSVAPGDGRGFHNRSAPSSAPTHNGCCRSATRRAVALPVRCHRSPCCVVNLRRIPRQTLRGWVRTRALDAATRRTGWARLTITAPCSALGPNTAGTLPGHPGTSLVRYQGVASAQYNMDVQAPRMGGSGMVHPRSPPDGVGAPTSHELDGVDS
jgi:hypothetical protein